MTIDAVKTFFDEHKEDPAVAVYLDSLADKRVSSALLKAERKYKETLSEAVENEIANREKAAAAVKARSDKFDESFDKLGITGDLLTIGARLIGDFGAYSSDDEFETKLTETAETILKARIPNSGPKRGNEPTDDADVRAFRSSMGLKN